MSIYYLDSSAAIKRYQAEQGSGEINRIFEEPNSVRFISRLSILEVQRAFNRRLRAGEISEGERDRLRLGFYSDLRRKQLRLKEVTSIHYRLALRLIQKYAPAGPVPLLGSLDALHLAAALNIREREGLDYFVCTDKDLCDAAQAEELQILTPSGTA